MAYPGFPNDETLWFNHLENPGLGNEVSSIRENDKDNRKNWNQHMLCHRYDIIEQIKNLPVFKS